jgi:hypothetical protein
MGKETNTTMSAEVTCHTFAYDAVDIRDASSREYDDWLERRVVAQTPRDGHDIRLDELFIILYWNKRSIPLAHLISIQSG